MLVTVGFPLGALRVAPFFWRHPLLISHVYSTSHPQDRIHHEDQTNGNRDGNNERSIDIDTDTIQFSRQTWSNLPKENSGRNA
jgi:hypothetical protein